MHTTIIIESGVEGPDCAADIVNIVHELPGIDSVDVSPETGTVSIEHSPLVSEDDICRVLEDGGFPVQR